MKSVDENTQLSLSLVTGAISVTIGFVFWLTVIFINGQANASDIQALKEAKDRQTELLLDIRERVIRIESKSK